MGVVLPQTELVNNLGIRLQRVAVTITKVFAQLWIVYQPCPFLDFEAFHLVIHALVNSLMDYDNALYMGWWWLLPLKSIQK